MRWYGGEKGLCTEATHTYSYKLIPTAILLHFVYVVLRVAVYPMSLIFLIHLLTFSLSGFHLVSEERDRHCCGMFFSYSLLKLKYVCSSGIKL